MPRVFRCVLGIFLKGMRAVAYETTSHFEALLAVFAWEAAVPGLQSTRTLNEHYCSATVLTPRVAWFMAEMEGPAMAPNRGNEDWRSLAEETSKEMDPAKLTILVGKLCRALDERKERKSPTQYPFPAD